MVFFAEEGDVFCFESQQSWKLRFLLPVLTSLNEVRRLPGWFRFSRQETGPRQNFVKKPKLNGFQKYRAGNVASCLIEFNLFILHFLTGIYLCSIIIQESLRRIS